MATTLLNTSHNVYSAGGTSDAYTFYFGLTLDSQDTPGNQSSFTATWGAKGNYGYTYNGFSGLGVTLYISTDGSNWESLGYTGVSKITATQTNYASKPFTKGHNNDGSLTIYYRAVYNGGSTSYVPRADTYTSGALSVTKIPRASTLNVATTCNVNNSTGSLAVSVTKAYSGYYDRFSYSIGSVVDRVVNLGTGTSGSIPYSTILNALPATAVATLKIALATYSDSGYTSLIGRSEKEVAVTIDISAIKPSITINEHCVVNTTNIAGYCFAGFGTLRAKFTSNLSYGASSVSTKYTISYGQLETTSSTGTSQVTVKSLTMPTQSTNRTGVTITATATDSRGASASITTNGATVYGYVPPVVSGNFYRCNSSNTADEQGEYAYGSWSAAVGTSTGSNSIQSLVSTFNNNTSGRISLAQTSSGTYTVTATDKVGGTATKTFSISSAIYAMQLIDDGGGKVGASFGTSAVAGQINSALMMQAPRFLSQVIRRDANTDTFRLIGQDTLVPWSVKRMTLAISTRHAGNGLLSISYGCDAGALAGNVYCQMWYYGNLDSHSYGKNFYAYWNSTNSTISFFWNHYDNDELRITCLANRDGFTPFQGAWVTDTTPYGELLATSNLGNANNANYADYAGNSATSDRATMSYYMGDWIWKQYGTTRPTTTNRPAGENEISAFYSFIANNVTEGAPMANGVVFQRNWDNTNHYDVQFFLPLGTIGTPTRVPQFRARSSTGWGDWISLVSVNSLPTLNKLFYDGSYDLSSTSLNQMTLWGAARYQFLYMMTRAGTDANMRMPICIAVADLPTSKSRVYGWTNTGYWCVVYLWKDDANVYVASGYGNGSTGMIYHIYGVGGQ